MSIDRKIRSKYAQALIRADRYRTAGMIQSAKQADRQADVLLSMAFDKIEEGR